MSASDLVAQLAAAGTPPELLAAVAQELFTLEAERNIMAKRRETERENSRRYRARGGGEIPGWMRQEVFDRDGFRCVDCGSEERLECDHIKPLMLGGETSLQNLQTLCKPCNARKRDRVRKSDKRGQTRNNSDTVEQGGTVQTPALEVSPAPLPKTTPSPPLSPPASRKASDGGTRLADDFEAPEDWIAWAMTKRGWNRAEAVDEAECFTRYWQAKPGREAKKRDWPKTWQNWAANSRRQQPQRRGGDPPSYLDHAIEKQRLTAG